VAQIENADALQASSILESSGSGLITPLVPINTSFEVSMSLGGFSYERRGVPVSGEYEASIDGKFGSISSGTLDFSKPSIGVSSPVNRFRTTNALVAFKGTASDSLSLQAIWAVVNDDTNDAIEVAGPFDPGEVQSTNWSVALDLPRGTNGTGANTGTNVVQFYAVNSMSGRSPLVTRQVVWLTSNRLALQINGEGKVNGLGNGETLIIGQAYPVRAIPAPGWVFSKWTDGQRNSLSEKASFDFANDPAGVLIANFVMDPVGHLAGPAYNGLFYCVVSGVPNVTEETAGMLRSLTIGPHGTYTGTLLIGGRSYGISGGFNGAGQANATIPRPDALGGRLALQMTLHWSDAAPQLTGTVSGENEDGPWTAQLLANPSHKTDPEKYTISLLVSGPGAPDLPPGDGYLLMMKHNGVVTISGVLPDGTSLRAMSETIPVDATGSVPIYNSLYGQTGLLFGWINLTNQDSAPTTNALTWIKKASLDGGPYPNGFTNYFFPRSGLSVNPTAK
jgi:hypothetical protein